MAWSGPSDTNDIISGSAGIGLTLLWIDQTIGDPASRTLALAVGRHLSDIGIPANGGVKWERFADRQESLSQFLSWDGRRCLLPRAPC